MAGRQVGPAARIDPSPGGACHLIPRITEIWDLATCKGIDHACDGFLTFMGWECRLKEFLER